MFNEFLLLFNIGFFSIFWFFLFFSLKRHHFGFFENSIGYSLVILVCGLVPYFDKNAIFRTPLIQKVEEYA